MPFFSCRSWLCVSMALGVFRADGAVENSATTYAYVARVALWRRSTFFMRVCHIPSALTWFPNVTDPGMFRSVFYKIMRPISTMSLTPVEDALRLKVRVLIISA